MKSIYIIAYSALPGNPEYSGLECYDDRHSEFTSLEEAKSFCEDLRAQGNWSIDDHLLDSDPIKIEED